MEQDNSTVYTIGDRNIYISGDINNKTIGEAASKLIAAIKNISAQVQLIRDYDVGNINIFIESSGGTIGDMWGLIDLMLTSPIPIYTYVIGHAESAALKIFLAGSVRYILPHATIMYHQLSSGSSGKFQDIQELQTSLINEQNRIEEFVKQRTFLKPKQIKEIREKKTDFYMDAQQAVDYGFATNIFDMRDWGNILNA